MSDPSTPQPSPMGQERFNKLTALIIAVVTTLIAIVTFLQSDAGARDDRANRDTKRYSMEAMGRQVSGDARVNYDYNKAYQAYYELNLLAEGAANLGDEAAAARYETMRNRMKDLSPLLSPPYFDETTGQLNLAKYEADVYVVETTALRERFAAASSVKDAWDGKANSYIVHLTLLAVSLFLFGLGTTVSGTVTRWVFAGAGTLLAVVAVGWAVAVFVKPVPDLRDCKTAGGVDAIDAYSMGVGLAHQDLYEEAIASFDTALACEPKYASALVERAGAHAALGNYEAAVADYEAARAAGDDSAFVAGDLAWDYYLLGRFDDAVRMNRIALEKGPDALWIKFDLALSLLASGQIDAAKAEYQAGMDLAARQVAEAKAAGKELPSELWWSLDDAALSLENLLDTLEYGEGSPPPSAVVNPDAAAEAGQALFRRIKSLAVALEFTAQPPAGELTATIGEFQFAQPETDDAGELVDYAVDESFAYGIDEIAALFDYDGLQDGQEFVFKVYVDDEEDPSWRIVEQWTLGSTGTAEIPISLAYSNTQVLNPGEYTVELYVDTHLAQRGHFTVESGG